VSYPADHLDLAVALVHEFAHIQLGGLLHLIDLTDGPDPAVLYAPWRDDPRPLSGLLQGIYAFTAIAAFWRDQLAVEPSDLGWFEYARARGQLEQALAVAAASSSLTDAGNDLVAGLQHRTEPWAADTVPSGPARAADLALRAHRVGWRIRNLRPDAATVEALAHAWPHRMNATVALTTTVVSGGDDWSHPRYAAIRRRVERGDASTEPGDGALLDGNLVGAVEQFRKRIDADPDDLDAWTGLGLATRKAAIVEQPALVRAVHRALCCSGSSPDPIALATWIHRATTTTDSG
jgi:hypothetical protein